MSNASIQTDPNQLTKVPAQISIWDGKQWLEISNQQTINTINENVGIAQKTADGKNSITWGDTKPDTAAEGDIWLKKDENGNYTIQVYNGFDWDSPAEANVEEVANKVSALPQNYYSADQPTGTDFTDGSHWYELTGTDSNGNPIYTVYLWNSTTKTWDKMLNSGEVTNASDIATVKNSLSTAESDIAQTKSDLSSTKTDLQNSISSLSSETSWETVTGTADLNVLVTTQNIFYNDTEISNSELGAVPQYIQVVRQGNNLTQTIWKNNDPTRYSRTGTYSSSWTFTDWIVFAKESEITDLQGNISDVKQTATANSTAIATNTGDISSLQQTATMLQSDITDNSNDISSLQQTASGLTSDVSSLQSDNTTNKSNISSLQQTASGLTSSVASVQTQVNNSAVGTNLITNSNFSSGLDYWIINQGTNADCKAAVTTDSGGDTCIHITGTGNACGLWRVPVSFNQNQVTTGSVLVKGTGTLAWIGLEGRATSNFGTISTESYSKVGSTMQAASSTNNFCVYFNPVNDVIDIYIKLVKLELGSVATDWSANPADNATVTSVSTLSNTVDGLSNTVSNNSGNITTLQTRANGFDVSVGQLQNNSFDTTKSYAGLTINSNGLTQVAGSTSVYLSNTHGFEIQKSGSDIFHVDTSGNLTMQGNITAGNISGVNFTGNNLTLAGTLAVTGSISADNGNVVINSSGLTIKGANLTIGDSSGNTTTYIKSDGTFITNKGVFTGSVDSSNISQSTLSLHNSDNSFTATLGEISSNYWGLQLVSSGNETWIDQNGIHNTDNNGTDTYIKGGKVVTDDINTTGLSIYDSSAGPWRVDITESGISYTGEYNGTVEKMGGTLYNFEFNDTRINGFYETIVTEQKMTAMVPNAAGDEWGINVPYLTNGAWTDDFKVVYNATGNGRSQGLHLNGSPLYLNSNDPMIHGSGTMDDVYLQVDSNGNLNIGTNNNTNINLNPSASLGLFGNYIMVQSTGSVHLQSSSSSRVYLGHSGGEMSTDGGSLYNSSTNGWYMRDNNGNMTTVHGTSFVNSSLLSLKTNISKIDPATALDKINQTNIYDYQYKSDVANNSTKHYASFIIDDVNEVSQYTEPDEFLSEDKRGRDDGTQLAYLTAAVQYLAQKVKELESK